MIEAVRLTNLVIERASCDQPHDQFDTLGARLADVVDVGNPGQAFGIVNQTIEKTVVKRLVDQTGPRALKLMAHAPSAPNLDVQIRVKLFHRLGNCLTQIEATLP